MCLHIASIVALYILYVIHIGAQIAFLVAKTAYSIIAIRRYCAGVY